MNMCGKCTKITGAILLVLGILFVLVDFGVWTFWNIQWWSALLLVSGICYLASSSCPDCKSSKKK